VYVAPHLIFLTYDKVFRTYPLLMFQYISLTVHVRTCSRVSCIVPEFSTTKCACSHLRSRDIWALMRFLALASGMEFRSINRCSCRSSSLQALCPCPITTLTIYSSVSQTVVRGPQVVLGFCPCGPFRLIISPKKTEKIKLT